MHSIRLCLSLVLILPLTAAPLWEASAWLTAPAKVTKPGTIHIILAVTDQGTPPLTRYQRVIITVNP